MSDPARFSVIDIVRQVTGGQRSAAGVAAEALARIAAYDAVQPHIWIERFADAEVLAQAKRVDDRLAAGERLPLAGVPFAIKDNIDVAGLPTTAACPAFSYRPERSATVVERLLAAGAVAIGKTNLDQFATGLVGVRSPYGAPGCVFNRAYVSGGSSSGSAVSVGAGLVAFSLGTDTAGSGRVPAAFNHLVGLKPTKGRWSTRGVVPACRSLDCVSVFAADVADAALVDETLTGFDAEDVYSRRTQTLAPAPAPRLGVPLASQLNWLGDGDSTALHAAAIDRLSVLYGAPIEVDIAPLLETAPLLYYGPWVAERSFAMAGLLEHDPDAIHPVVRGIAEAGLVMTAVDAFKGQYQLQAFARAAEAIWSKVDVLALPTCATAYRIAEVEADPVKLNSNLGLYTNFVNLLDMSAVAVPAGFRGNGTGYGVTLMGPAWADRALLDLAARYEAATVLTPPPLDLRG